MSGTGKTKKRTSSSLKDTRQDTFWYLSISVRNIQRTTLPKFTGDLLSDFGKITTTKSFNEARHVVLGIQNRNEPSTRKQRIDLHALFGWRKEDGVNVDDITGYFTTKYNVSQENIQHVGIENDRDVSNHLVKIVKNFEDVFEGGVEAWKKDD